MSDWFPSTGKRGVGLLTARWVDDFGKIEPRQDWHCTEMNGVQEERPMLSSVR